MKTVELIARKDISDYVRQEFEHRLTYHDGNQIDTWVVFGVHLFTREQRSLNKQLGINNINYFGNKNGY